MESSRFHALVFVLLVLEPGSFGGPMPNLFPANHYGKVDEHDMSANIAHADADHSHDPLYCHGEEQSPINLITNPTKNISFREEYAIEEKEATESAKHRGKAKAHKAALVTGRLNLIFSGLYNKGRKFEMQLTGHGVQGSVPRGRMTLKGSAIPANTYKLLQFHFHWSKDSSAGSEHYIDGKKFAMEMHLVHLSNKFRSIEKALGQTKDRHALLVLGVMLDADPKASPNPAFEPIVKALKKTNKTKEGTLHHDPKAGKVNLYNLIPKPKKGAKTEKVITYDGSLTTHDCNEVVSWLVFANPIKISESQVAALRHLYMADGSHIAAEGNAREIKKLNKRTMFVKNVEIKAD